MGPHTITTTTTKTTLAEAAGVAAGRDGAGKANAAAVALQAAARAWADMVAALLLPLSVTVGPGSQEEEAVLLLGQLVGWGRWWR